MTTKTGNPQDDKDLNGDATGKPLKFFLVDGKGVFEVHTADCKVGYNASRRTSNAYGKGVRHDVSGASQADIIRELYDDQIDEDEASYEDDSDLLASGYASETDFHTCVTLPESLQVSEDGIPAKPVAAKRAAKQKLARVVLDAIADRLMRAEDEDDGSLAEVLKGMTFDEMLKTASQWVHHLNAGEEEGKRYFPEDMPRPDRSDWR